MDVFANFGHAPFPLCADKSLETHRILMTCFPIRLLLLFVLDCTKIQYISHMQSQCDTMPKVLKPTHIHKCTIRIHVQMKHTYCICFSYLLKSQHTLASAAAHWTCFRLHKIDAFILLGRANVHHSGPFYIYQLFSILNSWCFSLLLFSFLASSTSNSSCIIDDNTDHSRTQKLNRQWKRDRESKTKNKIHQPHIIYT